MASRPVAPPRPIVLARLIAFDIAAWHCVIADSAWATVVAARNLEAAPRCLRANNEDFCQWDGRSAN